MCPLKSYLDMLDAKRTVKRGNIDPRGNFDRLVPLLQKLQL